MWWFSAARARPEGPISRGRRDLCFLAASRSSPARVNDFSLFWRLQKSLLNRSVRSAATASASIKLCSNAGGSVGRSGWAMALVLKLVALPLASRLLVLSWPCCHSKDKNRATKGRRLLCSCP